MSKKSSFVLCWAPLVTLFLWFIPVLIEAYKEGHVQGYESSGIVGLCFIAMILWFFLTFGVMIWLMIKAAKRNDIDGGIKAMWIAFFYIFNIFVYPVYWFKYIRHEEDDGGDYLEELKEL